MDLIDDFSDGRVQFAFVKVKDSNTGLPKNALIAWCGEGVPERTKGYFTSHMTAVAKLLHVIRPPTTHKLLANTRRVTTFRSLPVPTEILLQRVLFEKLRTLLAPNIQSTTLLHQLQLLRNLPLPPSQSSHLLRVQDYHQELPGDQMPMLTRTGGVLMLHLSPELNWKELHLHINQPKLT